MRRNSQNDNLLNNSADSPAREICLGELRTSIKRLMGPQNYFLGLQAPYPPLPDNIVLFKRHGGGLHGGPAHHYRHILFLSLESTGAIILDNHLIPMQAGEAVCVFPYQYHAYGHISDPKSQWLFITFDLDDNTPFLPLRNTARVLSTEGWQRVRELVGLCRSTTAPDQIACTQARLSVGWILQELLHTRPTPATSSTGQDKKTVIAHELVQAVGKYILAHLGEPVSIRTLAKQLALSESHLRNRFREITGQALGTYVRNMRVQQASILMDTTELSVSEIADKCGFSSIYAFSRTFRAIMGTSPREYRKKLLANRRKRSPL